MRQAIELHDSEVVAITAEGRRVVIEMKVYLHISDGDPGVDSGTGWAQHAVLTLEDATVRTTGAPPFAVVEGAIDAEGEHFDNVVPVPFNVATTVRLELVGNDGQRFSASADSASIQMKGEPEYVEEFKPDQN